MQFKIFLVTLELQRFCSSGGSKGWLMVRRRAQVDLFPNIHVSDIWDVSEFLQSWNLKLQRSNEVSWRQERSVKTRGDGCHCQDFISALLPLTHKQAKAPLNSEENHWKLLSLLQTRPQNRGVELCWRGQKHQKKQKETASCTWKNPSPSAFSARRWEGLVGQVGRPGGVFLHRSPDSFQHGGSHREPASR